ncbi:class I SAM-dependent methyltransferase [Candidatus Bathyarchaeota archaeon]|nr:class I SAM-dependent methyltransferase [Candidatus Bathyarchaeota archaeon]
MSNWTKKLFIRHADLFLKIMNERWSRTEESVNGMIKVLSNFGITSGNVLDLCCGNGRVSIYMAKKGFKATGVDMSKAFVEDARKKAKEHKVSKRTTFLEGDVKNLKRVIGRVSQPFDVVINVWTAIGYSSFEDDLKIFSQARQLSREGAVLLIGETAHSEYLSVKFMPTSYMEVGDIILLESRIYDQTTSQMQTTWAFYKKRGEDLKFVDRVVIVHHVYSVSELSALLRKAGWEPTAFYGSFVTLQPMNPLTSLNMVARAV